MAKKGGKKGGAKGMPTEPSFGGLSSLEKARVVLAMKRAQGTVKPRVSKRVPKAPKPMSALKMKSLVKARKVLAKMRAAGEL